VLARGGMINSYKILLGKAEGREASAWRSRYRRKGNIKIVLAPKIRCEDVGWTQMALGRIQW
jgi:hypothetical protein